MTLDLAIALYQFCISRFPRRALQGMDEDVRADLETYVRNVLHHSLFRSHRAVLEFFEVGLCDEW